MNAEIRLKYENFQTEQQDLNSFPYGCLSNESEEKIISLFISANERRVKIILKKIVWWEK